MRKKGQKDKAGSLTPAPGMADYAAFHRDVTALLEAARRSAARAVNSVMTATYWEIGRRIVDIEQAKAAEGEAKYGAALVARLSDDLTGQFGRGFAKTNLYQMRSFYLTYSDIFRMPSVKLVLPDRADDHPVGRSAEPGALTDLAARLRLPWSHYVRLLRVENQDARRFYEEEAFRHGWTVLQLDRQISTLFYERALLSRDKKTVLEKGAIPRNDEGPTRTDEFKDPFVLEFLDLKDEHTETELEEALLHKLEDFLLELGGDFCFVGRQRRLRIGDSWFKVDLLFFHRRLRCLVIIDLKLGRLTHDDLGQMQMYVNWYAEEATLPHETPPIGLILCTDKDEAVVRYTLPKEKTRIVARLYKTHLPNEKELANELQRQRTSLEELAKRQGR